MSFDMCDWHERNLFNESKNSKKKDDYAVE